MGDYEVIEKPMMAPQKGCCEICGTQDGYLTLTLFGRYVHKRCGLLWRGSSYNVYQSHFNVDAYVARPEMRTHLEFAYPPPPEIALKGPMCEVCGKTRGRYVKCDVVTCEKVSDQKGPDLS